MALMTQTDYGLHVGVSRQRVAAYIKLGHISPSSLDKHGKRTLIDSNRADADLKRSLDPSQTIKATVPDAEKRQTIHDDELDIDGGDFQQSRALNEYYKAALKKLEFYIKTGDLLDRVTAEKEAFECARTVRDAMLAIPNRLSATLAAESDSARVGEILRDEITTCLTALAE